MIEYQLARGVSAAMSFSGVFRKARNGLAGEHPSSGQTAQVKEVHQGRDAYFKLDGSSSKCIATGLLTCASVILLSETAPTEVAVFHATSGGVTNGDLDRLRALIGNPTANTMKAIYATPKPWDTDYAAAATTIETYIGKADTVCFIQGILASRFGINATGFVGF